VWSTTFIWCLAYSLLVGTCFATFLWLLVLNSMPAGIAGLGTMATPVMGLLFSWAALGEQPTALELVGMAIILSGSAILFTRGLRETPARAPAMALAAQASAANGAGDSFEETPTSR
jgi:drug/metabolite transporter (DMT)-like permease